MTDIKYHIFLYPVQNGNYRVQLYTGGRPTTTLDLPEEHARKTAERLGGLFNAQVTEVHDATAVLDNIK